ncbi:hypothetical protein GY12_18090 [Micrococcus luteus]|nr:hypothetical protein GY12_18090 [Micrococcus luteus]
MMFSFAWMKPSLMRLVCRDTAFVGLTFSARASTSWPSSRRVRSMSARISSGLLLVVIASPSRGSGSRGIS